MDRGRELSRLIALLQEHALIPAYDELGPDEYGHPVIYERVRATPGFPMSVDEVRALLEYPALTKTGS